MPGRRCVFYLAHQTVAQSMMVLCTTSEAGLAEALHFLAVTLTFAARSYARRYAVH